MKPTANTYNFPELDHENAHGWKMATRCGQAAVSGRSGDGSQRTDEKCPNIILINTDDMAWGDLSINNPSKVELKNGERLKFSNILIKNLKKKVENLEVPKI